MSENTIHCPFCGSLVESGSEFCHNCGASLIESHKTGNYSTGYGTTPASPTSNSSPTQSQFGEAYTDYQRSQTSHPTQTVYIPQKTQRSSSSSTAGLVALIFGILGCVGVLPCIGSCVAIVAGASARNDGDTAGKIGLILGWISTCMYIGAFIIAIMFYW